MTLFEEHPLRHTLSNEVHARPPIALTAPEWVTYLAFLHDNGSADREVEHLGTLAQQLGQTLPDESVAHFMLDAGEFRLKWERHSEFSSYTFFRKNDAASTHDGSALLPVPSNWRKAIPGRLIVASHIELLVDRDDIVNTLIQRLGDDDRVLVMSEISEGAGTVLTDFHIHEGFSRFHVVDRGLTPRQAGRTVQRLLEIETYRVMALLAFPVAKNVSHLLNHAENELADLMDQIGEAKNSEDERVVLNRLTKLAAAIERSVAKSTYRFGAATAYYRLVRQRIEELREKRVTGFTPIGEFMERRLAPAMATCETMSRRQEELSGRIARNSQLLRTRVDIELEGQNQALLAQMNSRAKLQLRLQETVEGLSIVAITYYGSQLVNYLSKGAKSWLAPLSPEILTALSIPLIAGGAYLGLRRMRKSVAAEAEKIGH